ncbi:MAG: DUF3997 domain-containing protein [Muribaculaceae bacterium]|nr:DUF3997 domain-containing protein [Muribaculaceae bacterium]
MAISENMESVFELFVKIIGRLLFVALVLITSFIIVLIYVEAQPYMHSVDLGENYVYLDDDGDKRIALYITDLIRHQFDDKYIIGYNRDFGAGYWIIDIEKEREYGPLLREEFLHLKDSLGIDLDFDR